MKLIDLSVADFLQQLGSASPAPGGGSAAALAGAVAGALCAMVASLTEGKEKHRASWSDMEKVRREAAVLEGRLRALVDEDTEAFLAVMAARRLPRGSEEERETRASALQDAILRAARAPLATLSAIRSLSELPGIAADRGSPGCITDAGTAAQMLLAGGMAAAWNVRVNLPSLEDPAMQEEIRLQAAGELQKVRQMTQKIESLVEARLTSLAAES